MKMLPVSLLLGLYSLFVCSIGVESTATGTAVTATKDTFSCIGQPLDTYIPDYEVSGCRKFYLCSRAESGGNDQQNSVLTLSFMCPTGQAFDTKINDCRNASSVVCDRQAGSRTARKITKASLQFQKATDTFKTSFKCAGRKLGSYYADPQTNCTTFHLCSIGENRNEILNFKFQCLHGEVFDDEEQTCVSYKSDCNTLIIPSTTTTTMATTTSTATTTTTPVPTTSITPVAPELVEDYLYDDANLTDYEYYDVPENVQENRKRRSTHIHVQKVINVDLENVNANHNRRLKKRQISSQRSDSVENLPSTSFTCENKVPGGHYADIETGCKMYHVCAPGPHGTMKNFRFLCSNNTIFSQQTRTCQASHTVECGSTSLFYSLNEELSRVEPQQASNIQLSDGAIPIAHDTSPAVSTETRGAGTRKRTKSRRRRPKKPSSLVSSFTSTTAAPVFSFETPQPSITILHPEREEVHTASPPIQATNIITSSVSQAQTFDAFIQAALQQEQEQRVRLGPALEQKRRQQEAEEQQQKRRLQVEDEQRRHIEHEEQQRQLSIQQENQQSLLLQQQHMEEQRILAAEQLNRQFEQHAPTSQQQAASSIPVRQTTRRRKRPKTTTVAAPIKQEVPLWHIQESQITTVRSTTIQSLIPPLHPTRTSIPNLHQHNLDESAFNDREKDVISFPSQQRQNAPLIQTSTPQIQLPQSSPHQQSQNEHISQQSTLQIQLPQSSPHQTFQNAHLTQHSAPQIQLPQSSPHHQSQTTTLDQPFTPQIQLPQSSTHQQPQNEPISLLSTPQIHPPQSAPHHQSQNEPISQHSTPQIQLPQSAPHRQSQTVPLSHPLTPQIQSLPHQLFQSMPTSQQIQLLQRSTLQNEISSQAHTSVGQSPQVPLQNVFVQPLSQPQQQLFTIPQIPNFPDASQQFQLNQFPIHQFSLPQPPSPIQSFPSLPTPQQSGSFQTLTLNQPGVSIESIILEHLKNAQNTRLAQLQQQPLLASASRPQATLFQPLGVRSRLIQFESPTSRTFEILTGHRTGRSPRQAQDFKRFKPIAVKLAENARQQQRQQHELQQTTFTCKGKVPGGYYADVNTGCQMFHICSTGRDDSIIYDFRFVCANWTLFDQRSQTCSAEGKVRCLDSVKHFPKKFFDEPEVAIPEVELLKVRIKRAVEVVTIPASPNKINFPETKFSCKGLLINRYYADYETNCQMFHLCTKSSVGHEEDHKFLCRNGTVFDQRSQACDDQTDALNCIDDPSHHGIGEEITRQR